MAISQGYAQNASSSDTYEVRFMQAAHSQPDSTSSVSKVLPDGEKFKIIGQQGAWLQIQVDPQTVAWVYSSEQNKALQAQAQKSKSESKVVYLLGLIGIPLLCVGIFGAVRIRKSKKNKAAVSLQDVTKAEEAENQGNATTVMPQTESKLSPDSTPSIKRPQAPTQSTDLWILGNPELLLEGLLPGRSRTLSTSLAALGLSWQTLDPKYPLPDLDPKNPLPLALLIEASLWKTPNAAMSALEAWRDIWPKDRVLLVLDPQKMLHTFKAPAFCQICINEAELLGILVQAHAKLEDRPAQEIAFAHNTPTPKSPPPNLTGDITAGSLYEVLQWLELGHKTGILRLKSPQGGKIAALAFREGFLVHAATRHHKAMDGLMEILNIQNGHFDYWNCTVRPQDEHMSIRPTTAVLEHARRTDEAMAASKTHSQNPQPSFS